MLCVTPQKRASKTKERDAFMKRAMIWFLTLCLAGALVGCGRTAAASPAPTETVPAEAATANSEHVIDAPRLGFHFVPPEKYENAGGTLNWSARYVSAGVQEIALDYYAVAREQQSAYFEFLTAYSAAIRSGAELPEPPTPPG